MTNVSLARIMYGTNEDFHSADSMSPRSTSWAAPVVSGASMAVTQTAPSTSLSNLLHRAWSALHGK